MNAYNHNKLYYNNSLKTSVITEMGLFENSQQLIISYFYTEHS